MTQHSIPRLMSITQLPVQRGFKTKTNWKITLIIEQL